MIPATFLTAGIATLAVASLVRLRPLHPAQLWTIPWAVAASLYVLRLLPYRDLSWTTAVFAMAATAAFVLCAIVADRSLERVAVRPSRTVDSDAGLIQSAARVALAVTAIMLAAFLAQASWLFGPKAVLLNSMELRTAIGTGALAITIKYVYASLAATVLCAVAAASIEASRLRWTAAAALAALSTYFSTGRATLVIAAIAGAVAFLLARPRPLRRGGLIVGTVLLGVLALAVFLGGGRLVGKTFENNPSLQTVPSTFTKNREWSIFALPYEYASAPIAALDIQVGAATTWGSRHGCAALTETCRVLNRLGVDVRGESRIRPFTSEPLQWNTYTALDVPLLDGGLVFALPIVGVIGALVGGLWSFARRRSLFAVCGYALLAPAVLTSSGSFNFTAPHLLGAALIAVGCIEVARLFNVAPRGERALVGEL